jgi:hypothetical protein
MKHGQDFWKFKYVNDLNLTSACSFHPDSVKDPFNLDSPTTPPTRPNEVWHTLARWNYRPKAAHFRRRHPAAFMPSVVTRDRQMHAWLFSRCCERAYDQTSYRYVWISTHFARPFVVCVDGLRLSVAFILSYLGLFNLFWTCYLSTTTNNSHEEEKLKEAPDFTLRIQHRRHSFIPARKRTAD